MGIVIFQTLAEGSSYVFTNVGLNPTYVKKEGTKIGVGLFPTYTGMDGVSSALELEQINNMVFSNATIYDERFDKVAYTSKYILLTSRHDLIESRCADVVNGNIYYPDDPRYLVPGAIWSEYKDPDKISAKSVVNQVPDMINAHRANTPKGKTVLLSKFDDSIKVLDPTGKELYHYRLESGSALSVLGLAANDEFIFFLRWKETLSVSSIANYPIGTGYFDDYYEIDQRFIENGEKVCFEWISSGVKLGINFDYWAIKTSCSLSALESHIVVNANLGLSISNNSIMSNSILDSLNIIQTDVDLVEINNAIGMGANLQSITNVVQLGMELGNTQGVDGVQCSAVIACMELVTGEFLYDYDLRMEKYSGISITHVYDDEDSVRIRTIDDKQYGVELADYRGKFVPITTLSEDTEFGQCSEKDNTSAYNIRIAATPDGLFVMGSTPAYGSRGTSALRPMDQVPCYDLTGLSAEQINYNPRSFVCEYDLSTKWPKRFSSQVDRTGYMGFLVNGAKFGLVSPEVYSPNTINGGRCSIAISFYEYSDEGITVTTHRRGNKLQQYPQSQGGLFHNKKRPHQDLHQRDGACVWEYGNGLMVGYGSYVNQSYGYPTIVNPKGFMIGQYGPLNYNFDYTVLTPNFLALNIVSFPKFVKIGATVVGDGEQGVILGLNFSQLVTEGIKVSSTFYTDNMLRLGSCDLQDSNGGVRSTCILADMGYREKMIMISNSALVNMPFLYSRKIFDYIRSLPIEDQAYHLYMSDNVYDLDLFKGVSNISELTGFYPQGLHYWTHNAYVPPKIVFDYFTVDMSTNVFLKIDFYAKNISGDNSACLLDFGFWNSEHGENLVIGQIIDDEWFIVLSDGFTEKYISMGALPGDSWDYYCICFHQLKNILGIYKNDVWLESQTDCYSSFSNHQRTIGMNSGTYSKIKGQVDQLRLQTKVGYLDVDNKVNSAFYDRTNSSYDASSTGLFCLNGENGVVDETETYIIKNSGITVSNTDFALGTKSLYLDGNSFLNVVDVSQGVGWSVDPDFIRYKDSLLINKDETHRVWENYKEAGDYLLEITPPTPVHFEVDSDAGYVFGIYNKYDDDYAKKVYKEFIGGYFPFYDHRYTEDVTINYDNDGGGIDFINPTSDLITYSAQFYDGDHLTVTKHTNYTNAGSENDANYLPTGKLFRSSSLNDGYDKEVNLPARVINAISFITYWYNYRKIGLDKTNKRIYVIRIKGGLSHRGYDNQFGTDLTEEARRISTYESHFPESGYGSYALSIEPLLDKYRYTDPIYVTNTYTERDILIYNYDLGFEDQINGITGLDEDDVICHLYEKDSVFYILTQVKEPEPASAEDFFGSVLIGQPMSNTQAYKYTRYVYKKTRIYKLEGKIKQHSAVLFKEFNYGTSSLENIMIQEVTDTHIWLNWDGVSISEPLVLNGVAVPLDGSAIKEVPFLQSVYFNSSTNKWEIMLRRCNTDNRVNPIYYTGYASDNDSYFGYSSTMFPKMANRLPQVGTPEFTHFSVNNYPINVEIDVWRYHPGPTYSPITFKGNTTFDFSVLKDVVDIYDESHFSFLRTEDTFQEIPENRWGGENGRPSTWENATYSSDSWKLQAAYPAVSRMFKQRLYDGVRTSVKLMKTAPSVGVPVTWIVYTSGPFVSPFTINAFVKTNVFVDDNSGIKLNSILMG